MSELTEPPYPADTRAKGWRFELDHERIRQSDTWALAPADVRPWLLMLWMVAWEQTPCGALPNSDALIAARLAMKPAAFAKVRGYLMRGWSVAADGRLYHPVMTERVIDMMRKRRSDSDRQATRRARIHADGDGNPTGLAENHVDVTRDTDVTHDGLTRDSSTRTRTNNNNPPTPRKRGDAREPDGFQDFYAAYPRHEGRAKAAAAFTKAGLTRADLPMLLAAVAVQKRTTGWSKDGGEFIPHPASWINGRRWLDEVQAPNVVPLRPSHHDEFGRPRVAV